MTAQARAQKALAAIDLGKAFYGPISHQVNVGRYVGAAIALKSGILIYLPGATHLKSLTQDK